MGDTSLAGRGVSLEESVAPHLVTKLVLHVLLDAPQHERLQDHVQPRQLALVQPIRLARGMADEKANGD